MSLKELNLNISYDTYDNDIVEEFYNPVLKNAVSYKRAVGFFSSSALMEITKGIKGLVDNNGKMQLIVSPKLSNEDIVAISKGYERKEIINNSLLRDYREPTDYFEEERLNILAHLIELGVLDIKVAYTTSKNLNGMFHDKVGIVEDIEGNKIAFTGSMNETENAFNNNFESVDVYMSWNESIEYLKKREKSFNDLWNGTKKGIDVIEFPDALKSKIMQYKKESINYNIDKGNENKDKLEIKKGNPCLPRGFKLRDYQIQAINNWEENGFKGIFDMATGTGKTYTGLGAITRLFEKKGRLAIIIVCSYQHLVEQWVEDIELFNMHPIIGYSASKQRNWKKKLKDDVLDFSLGIIDTFCFVTTNATYASDFVTEQMTKLGKETVLVIDEAHNFGSPSLRKRLYKNIEWRLALSATLERHGDEEGSSHIINYFGKKCIEYDIERAIREKKLTPYYYYPVVVYLQPDEVDEYRDLSYKISKECHFDKKKRPILTSKGKMYLLKRSKIVAGAKDKLIKLKELMEDYKDKKHILVYCGANKIENFTSDEVEIDPYDERQIDIVSKILGLELGMKVTHFTSRESAEKRELIKQRFAMTDPYQAVIAIKCLDEGVNIPSIKTAFILASTTNPKEYIQRRGRVLRLAEDKPYAVIYDFVTLMKPLENVDPYNNDYKYERGLAKKELARIKEFGKIALNTRDSDALIEDIENAYYIFEEELEEETYGEQI